MQKQKIRVGRKVWVERCLSVDFPDGLESGQKVKVMGYDPDRHTVSVEANGRQWTLDTLHVDTGWQFRLDGESFLENTLQGKAYLKSLIAEIQAGPEHPSCPELKQEKINRLLAVLNRNSVRQFAQNDLRLLAA